MTGYAELQVTTNFSFLRGASHVEERFAMAKLLGLSALGIAVRNSLAGIVRAHQQAGESGVRLVVGCRLDLRDGTALLIYPTNRAAYAQLCRFADARQRASGQEEVRPRLAGRGDPWSGAAGDPGSRCCRRLGRRPDRGTGRDCSDGSLLPAKFLTLAGASVAASPIGAR